MTRRRGIAGFSLIELMIALTIGLITLTVLATVFSQTSTDSEAPHEGQRY